MTIVDRARLFLVQTFRAWSEDAIPRRGAALAFYAAFSTAPLLVIALKIAAAFFGVEAARGEVERQMSSIMGPHAGRALQDMIVAARDANTGALATLLSLAVILFGASAVFAELQAGLNAVWRVKPRQGNTWLGLVRDRFLSFGMVLGVAFLLLVSLVFGAVFDAVLNQLPQGWDWSTQAAHWGLSFVVVMLLFAMIFKVLPDVVIQWRDVWLGSAVTAVLFTLGKYLMGWYFSYSSFASSYGLAGSFVVLLFWIYYSAQIMYLGAEMTQVYARQSGRRIVARKNAVPVEAAPGAADRRPEPVVPGDQEGATLDRPGKTGAES